MPTTIPTLMRRRCVTEAGASRSAHHGSAKSNPQRTPQMRAVIDADARMPLHHAQTDGEADSEIDCGKVNHRAAQLAQFDGRTGRRCDLSSTISAPAMPKTAPDAPRRRETDRESDPGMAREPYPPAHQIRKATRQFLSVDSRLPAAPVRRYTDSRPATPSAARPASRDSTGTTYSWPDAESPHGRTLR